MSALQVSSQNNVKIYTIASSSSTKSAIPDWLADKKKKGKGKDDPSWNRRVELIQDFGFPEASIKLKHTRDQQHIFATGVYKPQIRVYDLANASMKFDRHSDSENIQFEILSDDWRKFVLLQADRTVEFHSQHGCHYKTRIPKFGRDMKYHSHSCDLLMAGVGNEVFRLNLDQGRFLQPLLTRLSGINCIDINPANELWAFGGEDGQVEFFDPRVRSSLGRHSIAQSAASVFGAESFSTFPEISTLSFMNDGLTYGVGTSTGQVLLYDLRSTKPLLCKDHQFEFPIKKINFHSSGNVISADTKIIKIWDKNSGQIFTSIEPENDINDLMVFDNSGLIMTANEGSNMNIFFCPSLGPAPKWCSFLDSLTEELEESRTTNVWDDYKFVTKRELSELGLDHLIGSKLLKAYMHGFFVDMRLYEKARVIANPFAFDEYKKRMAKAKIENEQKSRISATRKLPKVNRNAATRLLTKVEQKLAKIKRKTGEEGGENVQQEADGVNFSNPTGDDRFAEMFANPDFEIDETSPEFIKFNTAVVQNNQLNAAKQFKKVEESDSEIEGKRSEDESLSEFESGDESGADSDDSQELLDTSAFKKRKQSGNDKKSFSTRNQSPSKTKGPSFYEMDTTEQSQRQRKGKAESFASRLKRLPQSNGKSNGHSSKGMRLGGAMSMTVSSSSLSSSRRNQNSQKPRTFNKNKRSAAALK